MPRVANVQVGQNSLWAFLLSLTVCQARCKSRHLQRSIRKLIEGFARIPIFTSSYLILAVSLARRNNWGTP